MEVIEACEAFTGGNDDLVFSRTKIILRRNSDDGQIYSARSPARIPDNSTFTTQKLGARGRWT